MLEWPLPTGGSVKWNDDGTFQTTPEEMRELLSKAIAKDEHPLTVIMLKSIIPGLERDYDRLRAVVYMTPLGRIQITGNELQNSRNYDLLTEFSDDCISFRCLKKRLPLED